MRNRWWFVLAFGGAGLVTSGLTYFDLIVGPPRGVLRLILWPADLLLWVSGPGAPLPDGSYEWTPVQDFSVWIGAGAAWASWVLVVWISRSMWETSLLPQRDHRID
jgi:hypothetical protein